MVRVSSAIRDSATEETEPLWQVPVVRTPGLTGPGVVVLAVLVSGIGAALDLLVGDSLGLTFGLTFLLACALAPLVVRPRSLLTAAVLPPLVFVGYSALAAQRSGHVDGMRELGLDVASNLALSAPLLFVGTALAVAITLMRAVGQAVAAASAARMSRRSSGGSAKSRLSSADVTSDTSV